MQQRQHHLPRWLLPVLLDHELPWGQLPAVGMRSVLTKHRG
jgi:hypothetical protein